MGAAALKPIFPGPYRQNLLIHMGLLSAILGTGAIMALTGLRIPAAHIFLELTGIPDPMCGMRTGSFAVLQGDLHKAFHANPLSVFFVPGTGVLLLERTYRLVSGRSRQWTRRERRLARWGLAIVLAAAWFYQLVRFGVI